MTTTKPSAAKNAAPLTQDEALLWYRSLVQQIRAKEQERAGLIMQAKMVARAYDLRVAEL